MSNSPITPAKLLLFGEHSVLQRSKALAVPYPRLGGQWRQNKRIEQSSSLLPWVAYLRTDAVRSSYLDVQRFADDLRAGWFFESTIPIGYGLGSSGALTAAVWRKYANEEIEDWSALQQQLGWMESFFHGASSGTDPLICYLQKPVVLSKAAGVQETSLPDFDSAGRYELFLLDTQIPRSTGRFVEGFLEQCQEAAYLREILENYNPVSDQLIQDYLQNKPDSLREGFKTLSALQWSLFRAMIPSEVEAVWEEGLREGHYHLKLCGAGGGGYLLGMRALAAPHGGLEDWKIKSYHRL
ncbi:MAG: hypothetical protein AAGH79_08915 [Bacteroidota bacterium]